MFSAGPAVYSEVIAIRDVNNLRKVFKSFLHTYLFSTPFSKSPLLVVYCHQTSRVTFSIRSPLLKDDIRNWCTLLSFIVQQYFKNQRLEQITHGGVFGFLMKNSWFCTTLIPPSQYIFWRNYITTSTQWFY